MSSMNVNRFLCPQKPASVNVPSKSQRGIKSEKSDQTDQIMRLFDKFLRNTCAGWETKNFLKSDYYSLKKLDNLKAVGH